MSNLFIRCFSLLGTSLFFKSHIQTFSFYKFDLTYFLLNIICLNMSFGNFSILRRLYIFYSFSKLFYCFFSIFQKTSLVFWKRNSCMLIRILMYSCRYKYWGMEHEKCKTWTWKTVNKTHSPARFYKHYSV